ncbi:hypothetical protein N431DRAFT_357705 [Stipitochalara longipes BDJ]|nr:hypothetical protein N431DRAFT_357705 [Stipitochalara longipes BDJ]
MEPAKGDGNEAFSSLHDTSTDLSAANLHQWEGLSADRRARLLQMEDDTESLPEHTKISHSRPNSEAAVRERAASPDAPQDPSPDPSPDSSSKGRADHLAVKGWFETRHQRRGKTASWSIHRIDPESPSKKVKSEPPADEPKLRQPAPTKTNEAAGFLKTYSGRDPNHLREHYGQLRINGVPVEEYSQVMRKMAAENRKDRAFQDRFAAVLAMHDGKKVSAEDGTLDPEGGHYDADTSHVSESGGGYDTPRDEIMGHVGGSGNHSLGEHFANEPADQKQKRGPVELGILLGSSTKDVDMNGFEATPRRFLGFPQAQREREEKLARLQADMAEYQSMSKECREEIIYDDNGEEIPRWLKYRKDKRKAEKLAKKQGDGFNQRFDAILAKHDSKQDQVNNNDMDFDMVEEQTMGDNRSNRNDYRSKRKREVDDEDAVMESMKHMRVAVGRKRSRNVDRNDYPAELAMEISQRSPESRRDHSSRQRSVDRGGRSLRDSYRSERSSERRPAYHDMRDDLDSYRGGRKIQERDRDDLYSQASHRGRSEKERDFINFSDPRADSFDNDRGGRTKSKYWKGLGRGEKDDNSTYRGIADDFDKYKESRKQEEEYRVSSRRRSASPRYVRSQFFPFN